MKKLFTFLLSALLFSTVMAQRPEALIQKAGDVKPVIDGALDDMWADVEQHNVTLPFKTEVPTVGDEGTTYWKMVWDEFGVYIIIVVNDDVWFPYSGTGDAYTFDKIELYFDTNYILDDATGGRDQATGNRQIAPDPDLTKLDGGLKTQTILGGEVQYAYKVEDPAWTTEWFVPWESIPDKDGSVFDKTGVMGFDVNIADNDNDGAGRKRMLWSNDGTRGVADENWNNMDEAGHLTFEGADPGVNINAITISGEQDITTDNGTVQLVAAIDPVDATQAHKWVITSGTGLATVSKDGVVQAIKNGTIKVKAYSADNFVESNEVTINVSGQVLTVAEISYLKNGYFDNVKETGAPEDWSTGTVTDGVLNFGPATVGPDPWSLSLLQVTHVPFELKDEDFVLSFKAWADEPRTLPLVFEDAFNDGNQWDAYASSTDAGWEGKTWTVNLTTEPTVFSMHLNFNPMQETTVQNFNFQVGMSTAQVHLDSIYLVRSSELALVSARSLASAKSKVQLYPNPVQNELTISKISVANSKVSVYNVVGQKLIEKTVNGTQAKFDVSSLKKGMYFVRFSDGTSEKFLKQ